MSVMRKVQPGDRLRIPAAAYNAFLDAAHHAQMAHDHVSGAGAPRDVPPPGVWVANASSDDVDQFGVLGIEGVVVTPTENAQAFAEQLVLSCGVPSVEHAGRYVIVQEPLPAGRIGRACVAGPTIARVNVVSEQHAFAEVDAGKTGYLVSADAGSARILWKESGTGEKWAVVCLSGGGGGDAWQLLGNGGTLPGTHFLGTTDDTALEVKVNSTRVMRYEPHETAPNVIGGHAGNTVASGVGGATIGGGGEDNAVNTVSAPFGTVGGGAKNTAAGYYATVGGGWNNTAAENNATVSGGDGNRAGGSAATVGGGLLNTADGFAATVGGGRNNSAPGDDATVSGGQANSASGEHATVSGGQANSASGEHATVSGGQANSASGEHATVSGGYGNTASDYWATVGGGDGNTASDAGATVGGGVSNTASGFCATVPGGMACEASGAYSFAVGDGAKSTADGAITFADSTGNALTNNTANRFAARASGGVYLYTNSSASSGAYLPAGGSSWVSMSDRDAKTDFQTVDPLAVLTQLAHIPVQLWRYKAEESNALHMGPMAQDFRKAFGLGADDKGISTVDADGVLMAAVQGLYLIVQQQAEQLAALSARVNALEAVGGS